MHLDFEHKFNPSLHQKAVLEGNGYEARQISDERAESFVFALIYYA